MENSLTTEEKIRQAATKVFLEKGFDGTTTRDIAAEAGINLALLNYYFRSKQKLFDSVFEEMIKLFFEGITTVLSQSIPLREKIMALIDYDFSMLRQSPDLAMFVLNEMHRNPSRFVPSISRSMVQFEEQLEQAHQAGLTRPISASHLMGIISANTQFIYLSKNVYTNVWNQTQQEFNAFVLEHEKLISDMIINYLFINRPVA